MEAWRGHSSLCRFKRGATGVIFHHRLSKFVGLWRIFAEFPQTLPKSFLCNFCLHILCHKDHWNRFWCDLQKCLHGFCCKPSKPFLKSNNVGRHFFSDYQGCCPDFEQIKTFGDALALHSQHYCFSYQYGYFRGLSRSTWNIVIAAFRAPRKFRMIFYNFCYYFWGQHCWWTKTNINGNDFFVFYKFPLS